MQAILTVFPQRNAGITLIKTGNLTARFRDGQRVMIRDVPAVLAGMPSGIAQRQKGMGGEERQPATVGVKDAGQGSRYWCFGWGLT